MPDKYIKFIDPNDDKKYYIYEYVRGMGEMSMYRKGSVKGKKTIFDEESTAQAPINALKLMVHRGMKYEAYATLEDLEGDLFLESFLEM